MDEGARSAAAVRLPDRVSSRALDPTRARLAWVVSLSAPGRPAVAAAVSPCGALRAGPAPCGLRHTLASHGCCSRGRPGGPVVVLELDEARVGQVARATRRGRGTRRSARGSSLPRCAPRGLELNSTPPGLSVGVQLAAARAAAPAPGTWNSDGVGEDAVEVLGGQVEREEVLLPHLAAGVGARHRDEARGALEPDRARGRARRTPRGRAPARSRGRGS